MIAGVQNKTGAISLLSLSPLPPLNSSGLKLVCIVNTPPLSCATATDYRLKTKDYRQQLSNCRLQTTDDRLKTTDYRLQTSDFRLLTTDFRLKNTDHKPQITD